MKLLCARPASFRMPEIGTVMRGEVFELPTPRGFALLYNGATEHMFCEQPPYAKFLYKRRGSTSSPSRARFDELTVPSNVEGRSRDDDGEYRWALRHERRNFAQAQWEPVPPGDAFERAQHVLLIRQMGLGDMLMLTPTIRAIAHLGKEVSLLTFDQYVPLFEGNPHLEAVWGFDSYAHRGFDVDAYEAFVDLMWYVEYDELNTELHRIDLFAQGAGVELQSRELDYFMQPEELEWAAEAIGEAPRPWIVLQQGGHAKLRQIPPKLMLELCKGLPGTPIALGHEEIELPARVLNMVAATTVREATAIVAVADLVIAPDSGLAHIAAAVGTPCVVLNSSIDPKLRYSYYADHIVIDGARLANCSWGYCNDGYHCNAPAYPPCLQAIKARKVIEAVDSALAKATADRSGAPTADKKESPG